MRKIFKELEDLWQSVECEQFEQVVNTIVETKKSVICLGAGRMGYSVQSFAMRLSHLGFKAYMLGDSNLPKINAGDIVLVNSSSGETPTVVLLAKIAKTFGAKLLVITSNGDSTLGKMADLTLCYKLIASEQLMKSAYEQFTFILFDHMAHQIFKRSDREKKWVENNHSVLE